jgi:S-adenosylmethionine synthetase
MDLLQPIYRKSTNYGHFTKADLPWEQLNKIEELKKAIGQ